MIRYELTRFGQGFEMRHPMTRKRVLRKLRARLKRIDAPYTIQGDATGKRYNLEGVMQFLRYHTQNLKAGERLIVEGNSYDQPKWVVRGVEAEREKGKLIAWGEQWVGRSPYSLGDDGPPGASDCSGFTAAAVKAVYGIILPHGAELQRQDPRIEIFYDGSRVEQDDFIFYNYGRLNWPQADHVELIDKPGLRCLGSRPSTNGVNWYMLASWDNDNILCYGRLKT